MKAAWIVVLALLASGCSINNTVYQRTLLNHQSIEVTTHVYPLNYQHSEVTATWRWEIMR